MIRLVVRPAAEADILHAQSWYSKHDGALADEFVDELVEIARRWLEALRAGDLESARRLSILPITIKGFNLDSGPNAIACGGKPRADGLVGVRSFHPLSGKDPTSSRSPEGPTIDLVEWRSQPDDPKSGEALS